MSEIVEAVKVGLRTALAKRPGWSQQGSYVVNNAVFTDISPRDLEALARAAIEAYEKATAEQEMHDQRVIYEAVERIKINPTKEKVWPTIDYFNGIPLSELTEEQKEEYVAYMQSSRP